MNLAVLFGERLREDHKLVSKLRYLNRLFDKVG
jgi:hypothetical protein